ncbi:pyruvate formate-lyase-activating protein [Motilibacter aurantiacus]|uniref:pyruvate formate-lyase-activating protein n=1 Tax=Motilibacter aurantiacus TaxID=2714955 RepID=UPI00140D8FBC|nr:pyruvate formate-lyase-activating protein [Motilibacter aurantiacus]NHC46507.1 pyruvate formate lyase-activating protein [Motilibacter aurantiacus]
MAVRADATPVEPAVGFVHSWDVVTGADGPGTRLTFFLAGCPLRCAYCHNPDTWQMRRGTRTGVAEAMTRVTSYAPFLRAARGGVTASGGEPLLQARFVETLFRQCRDAGLHTALDTSGYLGARASDALLADTSLVLLDVKSWDPALYRQVTGTGEVAPTLAFGHRLAALGVPVWLRYVFVPGLTGDFEDVGQIADYAAGLGNVERVDVLPFHSMGAAKYEALGIPYPCAEMRPPTAEEVEAVKEVFRARELVAP